MSEIEQSIAAARAIIKELGPRTAARLARLSYNALVEAHKDTWNPTAGTLRKVLALRDQGKAA